MSELNEEMFKKAYKASSLTIKDHLQKNEKILWHQKPKAKSYIASQVAGLTPFAIIWLLFDSIAIFSVIAFGDFPTYVYFILVVFFGVHLTPVWIWIAGIVKAYREVKNTEYYITNLRVIKVDLSYSVQISEFVNISEITDVDLTKSWFDKISKVGDIKILAGEDTLKLYDIREPEKIYTIFSRIKEKYKNLSGLPDYKFCEYCGRELGEDENNCQSCGAAYNNKGVK